MVNTDIKGCNTVHNKSVSKMKGRFKGWLFYNTTIQTIVLTIKATQSKFSVSGSKIDQATRIFILNFIFNFIKN